MKKPTAPFLAVARHLGYLTSREAMIVADEHARYKRRGIGKSRCGDIALELGLLSEAAVAQIAEKQRELRGRVVPLPDPLGGIASRFLRKKRISVRARYIIITSCVLAAALAAFFFWKDIEYLAAVIGIISFILALLLAVSPTLLRIPITITGRLRWLAIPAAVALGSHAWTQTVSSSSRVRADIGGLIILIVLVSVAGSWRHKQLQIHALRTGLLRRLVSKTYSYVIEIHDSLSDGVRPSTELDVFLHQTMARTARLLALNPYDQLVSRIVRIFGVKSAGAVSLWYLEPRNGHFTIRNFAAPGAPEDVKEKFDAIRRRHEPTVFHPEEFGEVCRRATEAAHEKGTSVREQLLKDTSRSQFISVTGYVYYYKKVLVSDNAERCVAFDRSYLEADAKQGLSKQASQWLDFMSFAALPVLDFGAGQNEPFGVLIAFKNIKNGVSRDDWNVLISAAKLMGLVLTNQKRADAAFSPRVDSQVTEPHGETNVDEQGQNGASLAS